MSTERVELVKQGYDAWNRGDRTWVLDHMSPEVEWITPREDPDPGTYRGHDEVVGFWEQWRTAVGRLQFEPDEFIDKGDQVIVVSKRSGRGETSGLEVSDEVIQIFTFSGEKCVRVHEYYDRDHALRETGIEELAEG